MIVLKFGNESGDYVTLNGIQSVRLTLRNKNSEIRSALSGGGKTLSTAQETRMLRCASRELQNIQRQKAYCWRVHLKTAL